MAVSCSTKTRTLFFIGLLLGILIAALLESVKSDQDSNWLNPLQRLVSWAFVIAILITVVRAYKSGEPVITNKIDHFVTGLTSGMSAVELLLH